MPDSKGEELQSLLRFEESVLQIKISLECKGTMVKNHFFSDETQVVNGKNKKIYVWRRSHVTFMPQCLGQYGDEDRQSVVSVLFWGCITYKGVGKLIPVKEI
jgi:hypothetical protein